MIYWVKYQDTGRAIHANYIDNLYDAKMMLFKYLEKNPKNNRKLGIYDLNDQLVFEVQYTKNNKIFGV